MEEVESVGGGVRLPSELGNHGGRGRREDGGGDGDDGGGGVVGREQGSRRGYEGCEREKMCVKSVRGGEEVKVEA